MNRMRWLIASALWVAVLVSRNGFAGPPENATVYVVEKANQTSAAQLESFEKLLQNYFRKTNNYDPQTQSRDVTKIRAVFNVEADGETMKIVEVHLEGIGINVIYGYEEFAGLSDGVIAIFRTNIEDLQPRHDNIDLVIKREDAGLINMDTGASFLAGAMQYEFTRSRKSYLFDETIKRLAAGLTQDYPFRSAKVFYKISANVTYDGTNYSLANVVISYRDKIEKTATDTIPGIEVFRVLSEDEGQRFPRHVWNDYIRNENLHAWDNFVAPDHWRFVFHMGRNDLVDFTLTSVTVDIVLQDSTTHALKIPMDEEFYDVFLNIQGVCNYYRDQLEQNRFDMVESVDVRMEYHHDEATQSNALENITVLANYRRAEGDVEALHPRQREWTDPEVVNEFKRGVTTSLWHRLFNNMEPDIWYISEFGISSAEEQENLILAGLNGVQVNFRLFDRRTQIAMEVGHEDFNLPFVYGGGVGYHVSMRDLDTTPFIGWFATKVEFVYRQYGPLEYFIINRLEDLYTGSISPADPANVGVLPKHLLADNNEIILTKRIRKFRSFGTFDILAGYQLPSSVDGPTEGFTEVADGPYSFFKQYFRAGVQLNMARGIKYLTRTRFYLKDVGFEFAKMKEAAEGAMVVEAVLIPQSFETNNYMFIHTTLANFGPNPLYRQFQDNFTLRFRIGLREGFHSFLIGGMIRLTPKIDWDTKLLLYKDFAYGTGFVTGPIIKLVF